MEGEKKRYETDTHWRCKNGQGMYVCIIIFIYVFIYVLLCKRILELEN
jgi:hypothetical protein